jgi:hypothetical protein
MSIRRVIIDWRCIDRHKPPEGVKLMITGPSYMTTFNNYLTIAYYDEEYRPSDGGPLRWINIYNDAITDGNAQPTHWAYPPLFPDEIAGLEE